MVGVYRHNTFENPPVDIEMVVYERCFKNEAPHRNIAHFLHFFAGSLLTAGSNFINFIDM